MDKETDEITEEEKHFLTKRAVEIKAPSDNYLEGEEARKAKPRGREVKGENNLFI